MVIARSPLRITLGGGGTDLPSYYRQHEGFLIAAAIDEYVYVTVMRPFSPGIYKKQRSGAMSNPKIDEWYDLAVRSGAVGGKVVVAGGGGFLMFYAHDRNRLRHAMASAGLEEVRFRFDFEGTKIVLAS